MTICDMGKRQVQARAQSVGFLLVPGFALMSYAAAVEPLRAANLISGKPLYRWWHAAPGSKPVMASNGLAIIPDIGTSTDRDVDMLFVCAGGNPALFNDRSVFAWLRKLARRGATIGGISGGPYILARAGLLDGRRVTLHWEHQPAFSEAFPEIAVTPSLFEIDGNRITCSGGISALDMMVALIERDHGRQLAAAVGDSTAPFARQNNHAVMLIVTTSPAPNSVVSQSVGPVSTVTRSKNPCTNRLCEACRIAAGHTLPERSRSHANGNPIATTIAPKQTTEYHVGLPAL